MFNLVVALLIIVALGYAVTDTLARTLRRDDQRDRAGGRADETSGNPPHHYSS